MNVFIATVVVSSLLYATAFGPSLKPESIRIGSRVKRGIDWKWGNQDGGPNSYGTVVEMREWRGEPDRKKFGVRVVWDAGGANTYRWGAEDAWDLHVVGTADADVDISKLRAKLAPVTPPPSPLCGRDEVNVLQALYAATGGPTSWRSRRGWSIFDSPRGSVDAATDPCRVDWDGVMCLNGHVVALDLSSMGLQGTLPDELMHLTFLKTLTLSANKLNGTLPQGLGRLASLKYLSYHDNKISGSIPSCMGKLRELVWSGYNNNHTGVIPQELGMLRKLGTLRLDHNKLVGVIPETLADIPSLSELHLDHNNLNGTLAAAFVLHPNLKSLRLPPSVVRPSQQDVMPTPDPLADRRPVVQRPSKPHR